MPGAFDGTRQRALMARASAGLPSWADLAVFGYETAQHIGVLIIYGNSFICTKLADFRARHKTARS